MRSVTGSRPRISSIACEPVGHIAFKQTAMSLLLVRAGLVHETRKGRGASWQRNRCTLVRNARDRLQVFVDGSDVIIGHVAVGRPRHDLEDVTVQGRHRRPEDAALSSRRRAGRVGLIKIMAGPQDRRKFFKRVTAFG
jgi:hypothetical protein